MWVYISDKYGNPNKWIEYATVAEGEADIQECYPEMCLNVRGDIATDQDGEVILEWQE